MLPIKKIGLIALPMLLGACASMPAGPGVMSLPGTGKTFEQFRAEDQECRQHATGSIDGSNAAQAQAESAVKSAAVGTAVGAVAGAAMGGRGSAGAGAGIGLLFGALGGTSAANMSGYALQQRYDHSYVQCMYAKGNQVPIAGAIQPVRARYYSSAPPAEGYLMPPPPSAATMPPPPPGSGTSPPLYRRQS